MSWKTIWRRPIGISLALVLAFATTVTTAPASTALSLDQASPILLAYASQQLGVSSDELEIFGRAETIYPDETGNFAVATTITQDGEASVTAYVDLASGEVISEADWQKTAHDIASSMEPYTAELRDQLAAAAPGDELTVGVVVYGGDRDAVLAPVRAQFGDDALDGLEPATDSADLITPIHNAIVDAHMAAATKATAPLVTLASTLGMKVKYVGRLAPMLWVSGTKQQIQELAASDAVLTMYPSFTTALTLTRALAR